MYVQKKSGNSEGEGGSQLWNSDGIGGVTHFGISEGEGGLKHGRRPWLGMDIFWNCPIIVYNYNDEKSPQLSRILPDLICKSNQFSACF